MEDTQQENATQGVTIKPQAIEPAKINADGVGDKAEHLAPYHTQETAQIAKDRADEMKNGDPQPYEFKANGYVVTERELKEGETGAAPGDPACPETKPKVYDVTADGFLMTFPTRNEAQNYALTHAEAHKDLPATVSKA